MMNMNADPIFDVLCWRNLEVHMKYEVRFTRVVLSPCHLLMFLLCYSAHVVKFEFLLLHGCGSVG